jgi:hypothetical protein
MVKNWGLRAIGPASSDKCLLQLVGYVGDCPKMPVAILSKLLETFFCDKAGKTFAARGQGGNVDASDQHGVERGHTRRSGRLMCLCTCGGGWEFDFSRVLL